MHFNIYLDEDTAKRLKEATENSHETRNATIRKAIRYWLDQSQVRQWPAEIIKYKGIEDFPAFESNRQELLDANEDPLA